MNVILPNPNVQKCQLPNATPSRPGIQKPRSRNPKPHPFRDIPRFPHGPMRVRGVQGRLARRDVRLGRVHPLGPLENLPERVQQEINRYADVVGDEAVDVEGLEDVEAVEERHHAEEGEREPRQVWLHGAFEDERVAVDALGLEGLVELDVRDRDGHPGHEVGDGDEVLEPGEDDGRAGRAREVRQQRDRGRDHDAVIRHALLGALKQEARGLPVLSQGVQVARAGVEEGVG